jgi:hypothetical protein
LGILGRGEKPCEDISIDGVFAVKYGWHPATEKQISKAERENRASKTQATISCVQVQNKSVYGERYSEHSRIR